MIDIALYVLLGIFITCVVQNAVSYWKAHREARGLDKRLEAVTLFWEQMELVRPGSIKGLDDYVKQLIDSKLAEKEGGA